MGTHWLKMTVVWRCTNDTDALGKVERCWFKTNYTNRKQRGEMNVGVEEWRRDGVNYHSCHLLNVEYL